VSPNRLARADLDHARERAIIEYFEGQSDDAARHASKVADYTVRGQRFEVWDILAGTGRWWVVTNPMNFYSQEKFPILDEVFTFHLGLTLRVADRPEPFASDEEQGRFGEAWRKWTSAAIDVDKADEPDAFQAIGMRCREALIALVKVASKQMPAEDEAGELPKAADVVGWCERIADLVAAGESRKQVRSHLKAVSKATWELANWLTHTSSATRHDAVLVVSGVEHVLSAFGSAWVRHERGAPDRCPECGSYKLVGATGLRRDWPAWTVCESCGWEDLPATDVRTAFLALDQRGAWKLSRPAKPD
jgi:predicted RNA-binding Zn-ribbon protein involved in translation (DUF1610 family)